MTVEGTFMSRVGRRPFQSERVPSSRIIREKTCRMESVGAACCRTLITSSGDMETLVRTAPVLALAACSARVGWIEMWRVSVTRDMRRPQRAWIGSCRTNRDLPETGLEGPAPSTVRGKPCYSFSVRECIETLREAVL